MAKWPLGLYRPINGPRLKLVIVIRFVTVNRSDDADDVTLITAPPFAAVFSALPSLATTPFYRNYDFIPRSASGVINNDSQLDLLTVSPLCSVVFRLTIGASGKYVLIFKS